MITFCLRTVFDVKNLGFSEKMTLISGEMTARLVPEVTLPTLRHKLTGVLSDGKGQVKVHTENRTFRGDPLLLELLATDRTSKATTPADIRPELESRTAEVVAKLTWSLSGTIGVKWVDALFSRNPDDDPNEWTWNDVQPVRITDFFGDASAVRSRRAAVNQALQEQDEPEKSTTLTAMRWWRHGLHASAPVDKFIAYWIVLETFAGHISDKNSIRASAKDALEKLFEGLAKKDSGQRVKKMRDVLYKTRCKALHAGRRDISNINTLVQVASTTAEACITFLLHGTSADAPRTEALRTLEI
jgi:hypothetical protein